MTTVSTLPPAALQASKAALDAAMAEGKVADAAKPPSSQAENGKEGAGDMEEGEIQEVDMESQAQGIRTVFSNPKDFNVKVRCSAFLLCVRHERADRRVLQFFARGSCSTRFILLGRSGSIRRRRKAGICHRHQ